jgi:hypothetical protein
MSGQSLINTAGVRLGLTNFGIAKIQVLNFHEERPGCGSIEPAQQASSP